MTRITEYLQIGSYMSWDEPERLAFLNRELTGKRPLIPPGICFTEDELAVVNAFRFERAPREPQYCSQLHLRISVFDLKKMHALHSGCLQPFQQTQWELM